MSRICKNTAHSAPEGPAFLSSVFEDLGRVGIGSNDRLGLYGGVGLEGGKLRALKGFAFDLLV
jgi:hypothetical protein